MIGDLITVLHSMGPRLTKTWASSGEILPYDRAKMFTITQHAVDGIEALRDLLVSLETDPQAAIIRGTPKTGESPVRRLAEKFDDVSLHSLLIEIDSFEPLLSDPVLEPEAAILEFVAEGLPSAFHGASFAWQLSASAGSPGKEHTLRAHAWFFLQTPYNSPTLRAWARSLDLPLDRSVLNPVQCAFTSAPIFEPGRTDPVPVRSGFYRGATDSVDLQIDITATTHADRLRGESQPADDPIADYVNAHWETWGTLPNGGILCSCPWGDGHTGGAKGDSSSVYFPSGTNGYPSGAYICLHSKCDDKHLSDFSAAIGYTSNALAALAEPVVHLNGHVVDNPGFKRDALGRIDPTINNLRIAIGSAEMSNIQLRYDSFRDEIVMVNGHADVWRAFTDNDYTSVRLRLEEKGFKPINDKDLKSIVHWEAARNPFDTARHWLDSLQWDGVNRVETFWIDHFGVLDDHAGYARAVGRYAWTALAARCIDPGSQADMVPVLVGAQGLRKSRGVAAMSPVADFATKMSFHESDADRTRKMRGKLVVEIDELQGLKSREREEILAWITRSVEHWVPKFKEMTTTFARRFVPIATTNEDDFLDNPTGERRWLPMTVGLRAGFSTVDTAAIGRICSQLWAEGRALYDAEGIAWQNAERLAKDQHGAFKHDDIWRASVAAWLDNPDMASVKPRDRKWLLIGEVSEGALGMPARMVRHQDQRRLGKILRDEGYELTPRKIDGRSVKVWVLGTRGAGDLV